MLLRSNDLVQKPSSGRTEIWWCSGYEVGVKVHPIVAFPLRNPRTSPGGWLSFPGGLRRNQRLPMFRNLLYGFSCTKKIGSVIPSEFITRHVKIISPMNLHIFIFILSAQLLIYTTFGAISINWNQMLFIVLCSDGRNCTFLNEFSVIFSVQVWLFEKNVL